MTATVDGVPLAVDAVGVAYGPANVNIVAISNTAPACEFFSILIWGDIVAKGAATYRVGGLLVPEMAVIYSLRSPRKGWRADGLVGSGSLTVTRVTPAAVAGTFTLQLVPDPSFPGNTATGPVVTNGAFDVTLGDP